ncbi:MAG: PIN domain-containing protein [Planctomycetaceae bacterium]|nr:PIN domain-containing protein [Planctomycetaceae bacterium]
MIAFDADVLSDIWSGDPELTQRAAEISVVEQAVPVVVVEEMLRGRLNSIRQAEAGKSKLSIERAYELLEETLDAFKQVLILSYSLEAQALYESWRQQKIPVGTHDLRIAAICVSHATKLVTRNLRDFAQVPGLDFDVWN